MSILEEHFQEHPDEYAEIEKYKKNSEEIEAEIQYRRDEKLKRIDEWRTLLSGKYSV